jgi:hypothetical protein
MKKLYFFLFFICSCNALRAQVALTTINTPHDQQFNSLGSNASVLHDIGTLPAGWSFVETGTNANTTYGAGTGSSNTGNTYSFGSDAGDRALGGLQSGSLVPIIGSSYINQTGTTITSLLVKYRGEQWRLGATSRIDRLDFQYSLNATALNNGSWTDVN